MINDTSSINDSLRIPNNLTYNTHNCILHFNQPYHLTAVFLAALILTVNLFVVLLFISNRNLRTPANYLLLSFSVNDFLAGLSLVLHLQPYFYLQRHGCYKTLEVFGIKYNIASNMFSYTLLLVSVGHLLLLSTERFVSLMFALRYQEFVTNLRIFFCCCLAWLIGCFSSFIKLIWTLPSAEGVLSYESYKKYEYYYNILLLVMLIFTPAVVLISQYTWMFLLVRKIVKAFPNSNRSVSERKALIIYCAMFICFIVCCVPFMVVRLMVINGSVSNIPPQFFEGVLLLRYIVSVINPLLYTLYKRDFRKAVSTIFPIKTLNGTGRGKYTQTNMYSTEQCNSGQALFRTNIRTVKTITELCLIKKNLQLPQEQ